MHQTPYLSEMERAVLRGLANGLQSKQLATTLKRSTPTIEFYVRTLFVKFQARSRPQLVALAMAFNVIDTRELEIPLEFIEA